MIDLKPASSSGLSSPEFPITMSTCRITVENRCHHVPWKLICGFRTIINLGQVASEKHTGDTYPGTILWEVSLCSLCYFTFKAKRWHLLMFYMPGMTESHNQWVVPHVGRPQCLSYTQRPGTWRKWGNHLLSCKTTRPTVKKDRKEGSLSSATYFCWDLKPQHLC